MFLRIFVRIVQLITNAIRWVLRGRLKEIPWSPVLVLNVPFDVKQFLGEAWREAPRDPTIPILESIDFTKVIFFGNCLSPEDRHLTGTEKRTRLTVPGCILFDARVFMALLTEKNQQTLEWIRKKNGATRLDFFGTILLNQSGREYVLYLCCRDDQNISPASLDGRWDYGFSPLDLPWHSECMSGVIATTNSNVSPAMPEPPVSRPISRVQPNDLHSRGLGRQIKPKGQIKL